LAEQGQIAEGLSLFEDHIHQYLGPCATKFLCHYAEALGMADRVEDGLQVLKRAFRFGEEHREHYYDAELLRIRGELLLQRVGRGRPNLAEAERSLMKSFEVARRQGAKSLELRAATSLVRFFTEYRPNAAADASRILCEITLSFQGRCRQTPDLAEAIRLLKEDRKQSPIPLAKKRNA
jgi:predicted ATPase